MPELKKQLTKVEKDMLAEAIAEFFFTYFQRQFEIDNRTQRQKNDAPSGN